MNSIHASVVRKLVLVSCAFGIFAATHTANAQQPPGPPDAINGILGFSDGEQIYTQICQGCHMPGGKGAIGAGTYPAFAGNPTLVSADYMAATILNGRRNMPAFAEPLGQEFFFPPTWLTDQQIANVVNYIRSHFGNDYKDPISADDVKALHPKKEKE